MINGLEKIDISKINDDGRYIDLSNTAMFDLSDEDILFLRRFYPDKEIAKNRLNVKKKVIVEEKRNDNKRNGSYKLYKDQKYNKGCRTKKKIVSPATRFIIFGLVVCLGAAGVCYGKSNVDNVDVRTSSVVYQESEVDDTDFDLENNEEVLVEDSSFEEEIDDENDELVSYIKHVCDIYQVNYDIVYEKLVELTDNFTNEDYLNGMIDGVTCKGEVVCADSTEELLVYAIRCMKQLPNQLGLSTDNLYIDNGYTSGTDYYKQISDIAQLLGVNRCLLYSIVQSECGFDSNLFNNSNNPAGLKNSEGDWWFFSTKEEGFLELAMEVLKYYRILGVSTDDISYETLEGIRDIHAPSNDGNEYWLSNVVECLKYAQMHETELFDSTKESSRLLT